MTACSRAERRPVRGEAEAAVGVAEAAQEVGALERLGGVDPAAGEQLLRAGPAGPAQGRVH